MVPGTKGSCSHRALRSQFRYPSLQGPGKAPRRDEVFSCCCRGRQGQAAGLRRSAPGRAFPGALPQLLAAAGPGALAEAWGLRKTRRGLWERGRRRARSLGWPQPGDPRGTSRCLPPTGAAVLGARGPEHSPAPKEAPEQPLPCADEPAVSPKGSGSQMRGALRPRRRRPESTASAEHLLEPAGRPSGLGALRPTRWVRAQAQP